MTVFAYESGSDNRAHMTSGSSSAAFLYDSGGRLQERKDTVGPYVFVTQYGYDNATDDLVELTYPSGREIAYTYNAEHQIQTITEPAASRTYASSMAYHASGALRTLTSGNGIQTVNTFDADRYWLRSTTAGALGLTYSGYDLTGNVTALDDSRTGYGQTFAYDSLNRLEDATGPYGSIHYEYDVHGNRTTANSTVYDYYPGTLRLRQQTLFYGYDDNGNVTSAGADSYTYTPRNMLSSAPVAGGSAVFTYDADDLRMLKTTPTGVTVFTRNASNQLLSEWRSSGTSATVREYVYAGFRLLAAVEKPVSFPSTCGGQAVPDGSPTNVSIASGDTGTVTFLGSACRRVFVKVAVTSGGFGCSWTLTLKNPSGGTVTSVPWCNATTGFFANPVTLPNSGLYSLVIDPNGTSSGSATVQLWDVVDLEATAVPNGSAITLPFVTPGQRAIVSFTGVSSKRYVFAATQPSGIKLFESFIVTKPDQGTLLNSWSYAAAVVFDPNGLTNATGTHTVTIDPLWFDVGTATLTVYESEDLTATATPNGSAVTLPFTVPGQRAHVTFTGVAGRRYVFATVQPSGTKLLDSIVVYKPNGGLLLNSWTYSPSVVFDPQFATDGTGTHTITINPAGSDTGTMTVTVYESIDATGSVTVNGSSTGITLSTIGQRGVVSFTGTSGQAVTVRFTGSTLGGYSVRVYKPDGGYYDSGWSFGATLNLPLAALPANGVYTVVIDPDGSNTGGVTVAVTNP